MKEINAKKVKSETVFECNGKKYKWIDSGENWRFLVYENGEKVESFEEFFAIASNNPKVIVED
jgi:hypothetical protein